MKSEGIDAFLRWARGGAPLDEAAILQVSARLRKTSGHATAAGAAKALLEPPGNWCSEPYALDAKGRVLVPRYSKWVVEHQAADDAHGEAEGEVQTTVPVRWGVIGALYAGCYVTPRADPALLCAIAEVHLRRKVWIHPSSTLALRTWNRMHDRTQEHVRDFLEELRVLLVSFE